MGKSGCGCGTAAKCGSAPKAERKPGNAPVTWRDVYLAIKRKFEQAEAKDERK